MRVSFFDIDKKKMQFAGEKRKIPTKQPDFGGLEIMGGAEGLEVRGYGLEESMKLG